MEHDPDRIESVEVKCDAIMALMLVARRVLLDVSNQRRIGERNDWSQIQKNVL
jgi:hypothetical protein